MFSCKCGSDTFIKKYRVTGPWVEHLTADGKVDEVDLDDLVYSKEPKFVKCGECDARVLNPDYGQEKQSQRSL